MLRRLGTITGFCMLFTLLIVSDVLHTQAQQRQPIPVVVGIGETLEIGSDTTVSNPEFSWYMTQNQEFVEAQRGLIFQKRLVTPGMYTLDASIKNEEGSQSEFLSFAIQVQEGNVPLNTFPQTGSASGIVPRLAITPAMNADGTVSLPSEGGVLTIDASASTGPITQFAIDIDGARDSNGNGNAADDIDNANTFGVRDGTPLRYFMKPGQSQRIIIVRLSGNGIADGIAQFAVRFDGTAQSLQPGVGAQVDIQSEAQGTTASFSASLPADAKTRSLLLQWDFGDGMKSLLDRPTHTYLQAGTYTVTLSATDLATGQILYSGQRALTVEQNALSESSSSVSSTGTKEGGIAIPWTAIMILVGLIVIAIVTFLLLAWLKNRVTGGIQKKLETVEKKLFDEKNATVTSLQLKKPVTITQDPPQKKPEREEVVERETSKTEFKKSENAQPIANGPVPSWLQSSPTSPKQVQPQTSQAPITANPPPSKPIDAPRPVSPAPQKSPPPIPPLPKKQTPPQTPSVAPQPAPKPVTPPPAPAPRPVPSPPSSVPAPVLLSPKPVVSSVPPPAPDNAPLAPASKPIAEISKESASKPDLPKPEQPIAFIRAESLEKKDEPPVQP